MRNRGFTLLEVLVATLIMAIAVTGLLSTLSTSMHNAARLTAYDRATLLARQKMDELLLAKEAPLMTPIEGVWDPSLTGNVQCGWRAVIEPFEVPPKAGPYTPMLERVRLEIWWMDRDQRKTFSLSGFRRGFLKPAQVANP
ncbi:MAG TPA: type II secretion system protein [Bryobacteraceae bacterium]|nr:type II secretion system protein [Bryobacteraceae bacterium]